MTIRHLLPLPGRPDTSAAARVETDKHHAAKLLTTQIATGNTTAAHLGDILLGAHPLDPIYTAPPVVEERKPGLFRQRWLAWLLLVAGFSCAIVACATWAVAR